MTEAQARTRLQSMVASADEPTLSAAELDELIQLARRPDTDSNDAPPGLTVKRSTAYAVGDYVLPDTSNGHYYKATVAGSTGSSAPVWPTSGAVTDGGVTWQEAGTTSWTPTFDLNYAAAEGWRRKAGKVATAFDFSLDNEQSLRSQMHAACLAQAQEYAKRIATAVRTSPYDAAHPETWPIYP